MAVILDLSGSMRFDSLLGIPIFGARTQSITIDRTAAARLGVSVADIDEALYDGYGQRQIGEFQIVRCAETRAENGFHDDPRNHRAGARRWPAALAFTMPISFPIAQAVQAIDSKDDER